MFHQQHKTGTANDKSYDATHDNLGDDTHQDIHQVSHQDSTPSAVRAVNPGVCHILRIADFCNFQIGCDNDRKPGLIPLINDSVDLLQRIFGAALNSQIIQNQQRIVGKRSDIPVSLFRIHGTHLVQDFGEVHHQNRNALIQQRICYTCRHKGLSGSDISP